MKTVETALQCLKRHISNRLIVGPVVVWLNRAVTNYPPALKLVLTKDLAVTNIVNSLKIIFDDESLQLDTLKLIQIIAKTSEGWKAISDTKGGWQIICQGTTLGDALVHSIPNGGMYNSGWCIGDTPYLSLPERHKLIANKVAQSNFSYRSTSSWTSHSLQDFMGLDMTGKTLDINTLEQDVFFELMGTLDLLPFYNEDGTREGREHWFGRIKSYEKENDVQIDEMVKTVMEMRRREKLKNEQLSEVVAKKPDDDVNMLDNDMLTGTVKPLYVQGKVITSASLNEADISIEERMRRIYPNRENENNNNNNI